MVARVCFAAVIFLSMPIEASAGGGHAHGPDGSHTSDSFEAGGAGTKITLSLEAERNLDIQVVTLRRLPRSPTKTLYGRVTADPRRVLRISAPFSGRVEKIFVLPGSVVSRNEALVRVKPIQVGSQVTTLKAKQSGYVTDLSASPGEIFDPTDSLLTVSDLDVVLFEGDLFDLSEAANIEQASSCFVHTRRFSGKHFPCEVETVDATLKGAPPVGHLHARIMNQDTELKPGMTGEVHLSFGAPKPTLTVPSKAVLGKFEKRFVFRKRGNSYERTRVTLGESYGDDREIIEGLFAGDKVVVQGHYQLQYARSNRSAPENHYHGDHGHNSEGKEHPHNGHSHETHDHHEH